MPLLFLFSPQRTWGKAELHLDSHSKYVGEKMGSILSHKHHYTYINNVRYWNSRFHVFSVKPMTKGLLPHLCIDNNLFADPKFFQFRAIEADFQRPSLIKSLLYPLRIPKHNWKPANPCHPNIVVELTDSP